jgi:hypothetical protein
MCVACILLWATGCNCARLPSKKRQTKIRGNVVDLRSLAKGKVNLLPFS